MAKLVEMDERVTIFKQMEENVGPVILINKFSVNPEEFDLFLKGWANEAEKFKEQPGFISTQLHQGIGGSGTFVKVSPCIIFFDEFDAIGAQISDPERGDYSTMERMRCQLLAEMDGFEELKNVLVLAATNNPNIIHPALLRPGRFDKLLYIPPPDKVARLNILKIHTKGWC